MSYKIDKKYHEKYCMAIWTNKDFNEQSILKFNQSKCNGLRLSRSAGVRQVNYPAIGKLANLQGLEVYFMNEKFETNILNNLPMISLLGLGDQPNEKISAAAISMLEILKCTWSNRFPYLNEIPLLKYANIEKIANFETMSQGVCSRLKRMSLAKGEIPSLFGLDMFPNLEVLDIYACRKLCDISSFMSSESVLEIYIDGCRKIHDFSNIITKNVQKIHIENCGVVSMKSVSETPSSLIDISIIGCDIDESVLELVKLHQSQLEKLILPPRYMSKIM